MRGVQLAACCKHAVGVCDDGDNAGGTDDGAAGGADGGDMRRVQITAACCKQIVGVCDDGEKAGSDATISSVYCGSVTGSDWKQEPKKEKKKGEGRR